ncbi:UvrD-helicase domain-containing protein [Microbacterium sp. No. 7]|uniref:UvrD-helicase domain-containing protein n=1 Tax=Microbacterium sp. No. 7 TaxID=1714373 RepID=UPI0006D0374A|nr:UvrD-helicase domain-containing protein [Microbacterium sp. No. 7]
MASTSERVVECLEANQSFVIEAGAGSGKTTTLVDALSYLLGSKARQLLQSGQRIVCITYTNVAANEIMSRINRDPLVQVATIHDFLWSVIGPFQSELRAAILAANAAAEARKQIPDLDLTGVPITYWQYPRKWEKGKINHDDVIALSAWMFENFPKLARLIADRFPIIFVDEYQDTHEKTIGLLLDVLVAGNPHRITVGLFGDYMQKIYNTGVGRVEREGLVVIQKEENYRCSVAVIEVLNRLRPTLQQIPGGDNSAGTARFFHADPNDSGAVSTLRAQLRTEGWVEDNEKVLMLTRRGIATDQKWPDLLAAYQARSQLSAEDFGRGDDEFGELFAGIESLVQAFEEGRFGDFLAQRATSTGPIQSHSDKEKAVAQITRLNELRDTATIGEVLDFVWGDGILRKPSRVSNLEERIRIAEDPERAARDQTFLDSLYAVPYEQVANFEKFLNDETPFSTHHGVKGEEYENVLVVLDDRLWNNYRFEAVLVGDNSRSQYGRTLNLFYVSCSRAMRNLSSIHR